MVRVDRGAGPWVYCAHMRMCAQWIPCCAAPSTSRTPRAHLVARTVPLPPSAFKLDMKSGFDFDKNPFSIHLVTLRTATRTHRHVRPHWPLVPQPAARHHTLLVHMQPPRATAATQPPEPRLRCDCDFVQASTCPCDLSNPAARYRSNRPTPECALCRILYTYMYIYMQNMHAYMRILQNTHTQTTTQTQTCIPQDGHTTYTYLYGRIRA